MRKLIALLLFGVCSFAALAQKASFNLDSVPQSLKAKASVIVHLENINVEVESVEKASLSVHKIFTVLNEEGKNALVFNEYSTRFISLDDAEIKVYDNKGKLLNKYKKKDMTTVAVGEGLVEDGYVTYLNIPSSSYPVTVEYKYDQTIKSTLFFPAYRFINSKEAVIASSYTAKVPSHIQLRYKSKHTSLGPEITEEGKFKIYKWSVKNLSPIEDEPGSVARRDRFPYINIVANQFSHYGFQGDFSSWKNFGLWISELYKGLDVLPPEQATVFYKPRK